MTARPLVGFDISGLNVAHVDNQLLLKRYYRALKRVGATEFENTILAKLLEEEADGVITSTSSLDESHQIRHSAIPIEARIAAAEQALEMFEDGIVPGARSILLDFSKTFSR